MKKKIFIILLVVFGFAGLTAQSYLQTNAQQAPPVNAQQTPPEIVILGETAKLGKVTFNHLNHTTKNFNLEGTGPIKCIQCHHVEQPAGDGVKFPFPADRTVTLSADTIKDAATPKVSNCRSCHTAKDGKPTLVAEIPQIKNDRGEAVIMTNQQAFHRNCASCHDQVLKVRPTATAPGTMKCMMCHKKSE